MGQVLMRAGGGKVSTENLTAENIKSGVTVTVKQGSKTVQSVAGELIPVDGRELIAMCTYPHPTSATTLIGISNGLIYADGVNYTTYFTKAMVVDAYIVVSQDAGTTIYGYVGSYRWGNPAGYYGRSGFVPVSVSAGQTISASVSGGWPGNSGVYVFVFKHH